MKRREDESLNSNEFYSNEEMINFSMEEYNSLEIINNEMEEFKVEEIQPQSFVEDEEKTEKPEKKAFNEDQAMKVVREKIVHSTSLGSVGSTVLVGAVGAAVVISPVIGIAIEPDEENQAPITINYGEIDFLNYKVNTRIVYDMDDEIQYKDVFIYFDENLEEDYNCNVINLETNETVTLDKELDYVKFSSLTLESYKFEVQVVNENNETVDTSEVLVDTVCDTEYILESEAEYMISYNDNDTVNLYYKPLIDIDNESLYTEIELLSMDENGEQEKIEYEYTYLNNDEILSIENIKEEAFDICATSYIEENGNIYSVNTNLIENVSPNNVDWLPTIDYENLTINFNRLLTTDLYVEVSGNSYLENYTINKDGLNDNKVVELTLSEAKDNLDVYIEGTMKYTDVVFDIPYKGTLEKDFSIEYSLSQETVSSAEFSYVEVLNSSYSLTMDKTITRLYFDGFVREDNIAKLNVYDDTNVLVTSVEDITDLNYPIDVYDLDTTKTYKFELVIEDFDGNEIVSDSHETGVEIPSEYLDIPFTGAYTNPSDVYMTYNYNGSFNAYIPMTSFESDDPNVYYRIDLEYENKVCYTLISREPIAVFENLDADKYYGISYGILYKDGLSYYSINDRVLPSGVIELVLDDFGNRNVVYCYPEQYENKILTYELSYKNISTKDMKALVVLDDETELEFVIKYEDIYYDEYGYPVFELDLTEYTFETAYIEIEAEIARYYGLGDIVKDYISEIKGSELFVCVFIDTISPLE